MGTSDGLNGGARREKDRRHLSQLIVEQYGWSHLAARRVASRLYVVFAACPKPPVEDITRGVNEVCSTSRILCS